MSTTSPGAVSRRTLLLRGACAAIALPMAAGRLHAQSKLTRVVYQTGWLPQPDKGGLYQAQAAGLYAKHGLEVELRPGGPQLNTMQIFLAGQADFVDSDSMRVLHFVKEKLPGVAVAAFGQKPLNVLLSHPGVGNDTLAALKDKPLLVSTAGRQTYFQWLKARFGFADGQARPYTYSMAPFLVDKAVSMEGFVTSEPFEARRAGVQPVVHFLADHGYENYSNVMLASRALVAERPEVVQRFVDATIQGWHGYLYGDPTPGNDAIRRGNPDMSEEKIAYARDQFKQRAIFESADVQRGGIGAMSDERWKAIYDGMAGAGAVAPGLDVRQGYTLQFVNKRVGAA